MLNYLLLGRHSRTAKGPKRKKHGQKMKFQCVIWESNPGLPDVARMATENFTTKPITLVLRCRTESS
ncbi:hypothetical protein V8C43DRAFT_73638 [Trichoderma afarasin]